MANREKDRIRLRRLRKENPEWNRAKNNAYRAANPEKTKAHKAVEYALARGHLKRSPCQVCGDTGIIHAHHDDYALALDVMWLCPVHHRARHRELSAAIGRPPETQACCGVSSPALFGAGLNSQPIHQERT